MKKIAAVILLCAVAPLPAYASDDDNVYASANADDEALNKQAHENRRFIVEKFEKLSKFSLLQVNDNFTLYGKLSFPRIKSGDDSAIHRDGATYGLRGQFDSTSRVGIRFGWERYIAGQNTNDNLYSLTAVVRF
ncbi:MAG TPA: hypothetical protein VFP33_08485 [Gallionella sp.]|nr:hypothetical protein [Gallionella sp.]